MVRSRDMPDGLPFRVYERFGKRTYSIGYKAPGGKWLFRLNCPVWNQAEISKCRRKAQEDALKIKFDGPTDGSFGALIAAWFTYQDGLPPHDQVKRAASTIAENRRESVQLVKAFGHLDPRDLTKTMAYEYLDACKVAKDANGQLRPRPEKGNKEIALARLILEYGIRTGRVEINPFTGITQNRTRKTRRLVTQSEMDLAIEVGRRLGGPQHIVAMGLKMAWLCVRRSVEVRGLMVDSIQEEGILWTDGKDNTKARIRIEWSPELRATVDEVLSIRRNRDVTTTYVFGNLRGTKYTKGGWKAVLQVLMKACVNVAHERSIAFMPFSLQDCRPMGVTDKMEKGDSDTRDATGHNDDKMINVVYDRRKVKSAKPAK
jgi:integrase